MARGFWLLILLLMLGAAFRLYGLSIQSLWNDELASWFMSSRESLQAVIVEEVAPDVHPPGYQVILYFMMRLFGDSEFSLRLPSAFAGIVSIAAIFTLGKRLYSWREGLVAAALLAAFITPIYYSQEARAYAFVLLFTLISAYWWVVLVEQLKARKQALKAAITYTISAAVLAYLHYFGLFMVILQGAAMLLLLRRGWYWLGIYSVIVLCYLPWLPSFIWQMQNRRTGNTNTGALLPPPRADAPLEFLSFLFKRPDWLAALILGLYALLLVGSLFVVHRTNTRDYPAALLALWLVIPFVIIYGYSLLQTPILTYRNLIILLPPAYLLLARALVYTPALRQFTRLIAMGTAVILSAELLQSGYYTRVQKEQFREAVEFVVENESRYPNSVIVGLAWSENLLNYYFRKFDSERRVDIIAGWEADKVQVADLIEAREAEYIWLVRGNRIPETAFMAYFVNDNFVFTHTRQLYGADVILYRRR